MYFVVKLAKVNVMLNSGFSYLSDALKQTKDLQKDAFLAARSNGDTEVNSIFEYMAKSHIQGRVFFKSVFITRNLLFVGNTAIIIFKNRVLIF